MARTVLGRNAYKSNTTPQGGAGGTMGGMPSASGGRPGRRQILLGDELYLWILVFIEAGGIGWARTYLKKRHGG